MVTIKHLLENAKPNFANVFDRRKYGYHTKAAGPGESGFHVYCHSSRVGHGKDAAECTAVMHKHHEENGSLHMREETTTKTVRQLMEGRAEKKTEFKGGTTATGEKANTIDVAPRLVLAKKRSGRGAGMRGAYDNRML